MAIKPPVPPSNSVEDMRVAFQQLTQAIASELQGGSRGTSPGSALGRLGLAVQAGKTSTEPGVSGPAGAPGLTGEAGPAGADGSIADVVVEQGSTMELLTDNDGVIIVSERGMAFIERTVELFAVTDNFGEYVMEG